MALMVKIITTITTTLVMVIVMIVCFDNGGRAHITM